MSTDTDDKGASSAPANEGAGLPRFAIPVVLAVASAMVTVGFFSLVMTVPDDEPPPPPTLEVSDDTAEGAAESFLDAWRKRNHEVAAQLSEGAALEQVQERQAADAALDGPDLELRAQVWDAMAQDRLALRLEESMLRDDGSLELHGIAEGTFVDNPYRRRVFFLVIERDDGWRVVEVEFGEILTPLPPAFRLDD